MFRPSISERTMATIFVDERIGSHFYSELLAIDQRAEIQCAKDFSRFLLASVCMFVWQRIVFREHFDTSLDHDRTIGSKVCKL